MINNQIILRLLLPFLCVAICMPLCGCTGQNDDSSDQFAGPWGAEIADAYQEADADLAKAVLRDGEISDQDVAEMKNALRSCLVASGLEVKNIGDDGSLNVFLALADGETMDQNAVRVKNLADSCQENVDWGLVMGLYSSMRGNPDNADPYLMMSECLVRLGVRPEGYSPQDYKEEFEAGVFQSIDSDDPGNAEKFWSCNADPAHAQ